MSYAVVLAGFGGQGVLLMGDLLAFTAMRRGMHVTWMPSYGPEMRGGAASCTVIFSGERIGSPIVEKAQAVIAMSTPALERFKLSLEPHGLLFVNSSLVPVPSGAWGVPADELAVELGNRRMANMVMLGAFLAKSGALDLAAVKTVLPEFLAQGKKEKLLPSFLEALDKGSGCFNPGQFSG